MFKTLSLIFALFVVSVGLMSAAEDEELITVRFNCLAWDTIKANGVKYLDGEEVVKLRVGQSRFNGPYQYTGTNPIVFFREQPGTEPGEVLRVPVASAFIQPGFENALILFTEVAARGREDRSPHTMFKALVWNNDLSVYPAGTYRVINLSQHEVGGIIGVDKFIIPGKQTKMISKPSSDGEGMRIHFSMKIDDMWEPKINTAWKYRADKRYLVFLTDVNNNGRPYLKLKTITENLEPRN